jgi:CRISPR/Cas system-associated exonuclease Cas4 (RecB family)
MVNPLKVCNNTEVKKFTWSYSSISQFKQCPKKYYHLKVLKDIKETETEAILYGKRVHKSAEDYVRDGKEIEEDFSYIKPSIDSILNNFKGKTHPELRLGLTENLEPCGFFDDDVWYRCVIDLLIIDPDGKRAVIVDYKTGKSKYADTAQLELMSLAVFKNYPEVETIKAGLLFFTNNVLIKENYSLDKESELWLKWIEEVNKIKKCFESEVWNPKPNFTCYRFCPVLSCHHNGRN